MVGLQFLGHEMDAGDVVGIAFHLFLMAGGPGLAGKALGIERLREDDALHHLADESVGEDENGNPVFFGDGEGFVGEIGSVLHALGGEDDRVIVAVAAAAGGLEIVALAGRDAAEAGAGAGHVDDDGGKIGAAEVGDAFLLQGNAGAGRAGHGAGARGGGSIDHIDGRYFALGLDEGPAFGEHVHRHIGREFVLGRDRIPEIGLAAGAHGGLADSLVAFHEANVFGHGLLLHSL